MSSMYAYDQFHAELFLLHFLCDIHVHLTVDVDGAKGRASPARGFGARGLGSTPDSAGQPRYPVISGISTTHCKFAFSGILGETATSHPFSS